MPAKIAGDVAIPVSSGNLTEDFDLTCRQVVVAHMFCELCGQLRWDALLPRVDLANHLNQLLGRHALEQVAAGSRFEGALDFHIAFKGRQDNDARFGEFSADGYHRVDTTLRRKAGGEESYVWLVLPKLLNGFLRVGRLSYQHHIRLIVDDRGKALPKQRMVIHTENPNSSGFAHRTRSLSMGESSSSASRGCCFANHFVGRSASRRR